jgi:hypothetical protein
MSTRNFVRGALGPLWFVERYAARIMPRQSWGAFCLAIAATSLASCHDDHCWDCVSYQPYPQEISLGLAAANFTGSGHASVITTSTVLYYPNVNAGNLKSYLSSGAGTFLPAVFTSDGDDPLYLASADLNGDHLLDLVSASYSDGTLAVFLNSSASPGTFAAPILLSSPGASQVAIADMNGDGLPDLVSADFNVSLFVQTSPGVFAAAQSLYAQGANWVAVGDLNGDGSPDVALTDSVGVKLLLHTGAAGSLTFAAPVPLFTQTANSHVTGANIIAIADVDGDGLNDLVISDPGPTGGSAPTVNILLQDPAHPGQFLAPVSYPTASGSLALSIVVTDLNADGHPDIVIGGSYDVTVLLQNAAVAGTFLTPVNYVVPNANQIAVADVDGDGRPDIVVSSGATQPVVNGIITNSPGVLVQSHTSIGTFLSLQNFPIS